MHVNESTALGTSGDVELKDEAGDEPSSTASTSTTDSTTTITSTASTTSITDASSPASATDCVSPSRDSAAASSDSVLPVNGLTVSPNSGSVTYSLGPSSRPPLCRDSLLSSARDSLTLHGSGLSAVNILKFPLNGASDSAVETDESSQDEMLIPPEDVKQEAEDSDCQDTVDGTILHRLSHQDFKLEPADDSNSSCSLASFSNGFLNGESDASMRKRLFTSLSQSFPGSALSRILHSCDTMPMDSDDEDLVVTQDRLSSSCFGEIRLEKGEIEDDELTSLAWLQDSDLLKNMNAGEEDVKLVEDQKENADGHKNGDAGGGGNFVPQTHPPHVPYNPQKHVNSKPPYSFSCLIFMAVEECPEKKLPVKDIYNWILTHFPYFQNAPTGWKNSVRHNLSLNKCFKKVEKDKGTSIGKGSLWCIDPDYRPNLLQALRKTPYHPYHQLQMMSTMQAQQQIHHVQGMPPGGFRPMPLTQRAVPNTVSPHLFPFLSRRLAQTGCEYFDREMQDVANTLVAMKGFASKNGSDLSGPNSTQALLKRRYNGMLKRQGPIIVTAHPNEDHNYSSVKIREEDAESGTSSIDNEYDFGDEDDDDDISEPSDYPSDWDCGSDGDEVDGDLPPAIQRKRLKIDLKRKEDKDKDEEEKQEGAKLLLSLAGVSGFSGGEEEERRSPRKSHSSASGKGAAASSSSRLTKSSSSSPSSSKGQSSAAKASASSVASKSLSSLSSSQSSSSSSRTPSKSSSRTPSSKSSSKTSSSKSGAAASSSSSKSSAGASASKSSAGVSSSSSKTSAGASSSSPKLSATAQSLSKSAPSLSLKSSLTESSSKPSSVSLSKSSATTSASSSKTTVSSTPSSTPMRPSSAGSVSSLSASPSSKKASIIMTRRGKAAAEAAASAAAAAAAPGVWTRGKKLSSSS